MLTLSVVASVVLQLHHSRQMPGADRLRAWPLTLSLQVALLYVPFGLQPIHFIAGLPGFAAGSCLLLLPGRWRWPAFTAVVVSWCVLWGTVPEVGLAANPGIADMLYLVAGSTGIGVLVYGLSWLTQTASDLEALRSELARMAVLAERLRVARDVHDLLGLGLSAIALKTDLVARLIGRDDARAAAEIAEIGRICAHARADIRLVTGASRHLPLDAELAAAQEILASAGVAVHADPGTGPRPAAADTVLAPVLREAVTNILRHSAATRCTIEVTATGGALRLRVGNDGPPDRPYRSARVTPCRIRPRCRARPGRGGAPPAPRATAGRRCPPHRPRAAPRRAARCAPPGRTAHRGPRTAATGISSLFPWLAGARPEQVPVDVVRTADRTGAGISSVRRGQSRATAYR